jgi:hypothetical protein
MAGGLTGRDRCRRAPVRWGLSPDGAEQTTRPPLVCWTTVDPCWALSNLPTAARQVRATSLQRVAIVAIGDYVVAWAPSTRTPLRRSRSSALYDHESHSSSWLTGEGRTLAVVHGVRHFGAFRPSGRRPNPLAWNARRPVFLAAQAMTRPSPVSLRKNGPYGPSRTGRVRPVTAGQRAGRGQHGSGQAGWYRGRFRARPRT